MLWGRLRHLDSGTELDAGVTWVQEAGEAAGGGGMEERSVGSAPRRWCRLESLYPCRIEWVQPFVLRTEEAIAWELDAASLGLFFGKSPTLDLSKARR